MWNKIKSFLKGFGSVLDIAGTNGPDLGYDPVTQTDEEAFARDAEALRGDWDKVCSDFNNAAKNELQPPR